MLDIETFGTNADAVVVSISAIVFDEGGDTGATFEVGLELKSQLLNGRAIDKDTVYWWVNQSKEARRSLFALKEENTTDVLLKFNEFIKDNFDDVRSVNLWGNGATFDNVIVRSLYDSFDIHFVLPYWCDKDVRTLTYLTDINPKDYEFDGVKHNGICDCLHQIKYCTDGLKKCQKKK